MREQMTMTQNISFTSKKHLPNLFLFFIFFIFIFIVAQTSSLPCSQLRTCSQCLTPEDDPTSSQNCVWCTQTSTCIDTMIPGMSCHNASHIFYMGDAGGTVAGGSKSKRNGPNSLFHLIRSQFLGGNDFETENDFTDSFDENHENYDGDDGGNYDYHSKMVMNHHHHHQMSGGVGDVYGRVSDLVGMLSQNNSSHKRATERYPVDDGVVNPVQTHVMEQCPVQYTRLDQCRSGMDLAQIYLPVSQIVRNLQEGGFMMQPILPIPQSFLSQHIVTDHSHLLHTGGNDDTYLHSVLKEYIITMGAYFIHTDTHKSRYTPRLFSFFTNLNHQRLRANITLSPRTNRIKVKKAKASDSELIWNWYTSDMGIIANPSKYEIGMMIAMYNRTSTEPICLHYQIPYKIKNRTVFFEMFIGVHTLVGIPLFAVTLAILVIFALRCPFDNDDESETDQNWGRMAQELEREIRAEEGETADSPSAEQLIRGRASFDMLWFITINATKIIRQCGFPAYYWWKFQRRVVLMVLVFACITLPVLLPIHIVKNLNQKYYPDFSLTTFGRILDGSKVSIAHFTLSTVYYLICALNMILTVRLLILKRRREKLSSITIRVTNLPTLQISIEQNRFSNDIGITNIDDIERREQLLSDHFNSIVRNISSVSSTSNPLEEGFISPENSVENAVLCANIIPDMHHVSALLSQYEKLKMKLSDCTPKEQAKIVAKMDEVQDKIIKETQKKPVVSTSAFVTFRNADYMQECIKAHSKQSKDNMAETVSSLHISSSGCRDWKVHKTNWEPEDIEWDNIYVPQREAIVRTVLSYFTATTFILISVALLLSYIFMNGLFGYASRVHSRQSKRSILSNNSSSQFAMIASLFPYYFMSTFLAILNEVFARIFYYCSKQEKMKTRSRFEASYLLKTTILCTFCSLLAPYYGDLQMLKVSPKAIYTNSGLKLIYLLISQTFISKGLVFVMDIVTVIWSHWRTGGRPERPQYSFVSSYSISLYIFYTLTALGTRFPILFIPGVIFFVLNYFVDTFLLCFLYEKTKGVGHVEFGIASLLTLLFSSLAVLTSPSFHRYELQIASSAFFIVTCALLLLTVVISRYMNRKRVERLNTEEETKYMNRYANPQLANLLKINY